MAISQQVTLNVNKTEYMLIGSRQRQFQLQPRTQALSSTLLAGENTLAGAGHVTHTKLIAYQGDGKVSGLILHVSTSALRTSIARSGRLKNHLSESYILQNTC